jgi:hypothetical protein
MTPEELLLKAIFGEEEDEEEMMLLKVHNGTPTGSGNLCESCKHALVIKGHNSREHIECSMQAKTMTFQVRQCSGYLHGGASDLREMQKIAWIVETRNRGPWGFRGEKNTEIVVRPPRQPGELPAPEQAPGEGE